MELLRQTAAGRTVKTEGDLGLAAAVLHRLRGRGHMPESTRLASTVETWWPAILVAFTTGATNARTEGLNRITKQVKRVGCGFRNIDNYQRRIMAHIAVVRPRGQAA
jgi:transposase